MKKDAEKTDARVDLKNVKLLRIYEYINNHLYFSNADMHLGKYMDFSSNLVFGVLTSVNKGKQLQMGEYGVGKTTSSEFILSMVYGIPKQVLVRSTIKGSPEMTLEKVGRLNLGELNKGSEVVIWSNFVTLEPKIIDEFNRIPEAKQNLFLEGMDRGNWQYLNDMVRNGDFAMFATVNYRDSGNGKLVEAAVDRFEVAVESRHPGVTNSRQMRLQYDDRSQSSEVCEDNDASEEMLRVMLSDKPYQEKKKRLDEIQAGFRKTLEARTGLKLLSQEELSEIKSEIRSLPIGADGQLFLDAVIAEMYSCQVFGQKRSNEECKQGCHYQKYACGKKRNSDSVRTMYSQMKYAKSLAWLLGDKEVTPQHLATVMPYTMWHKMKFTENYANPMKDDMREDPLPLYLTKKLVEDISDNFSRMKNNQKQMLQFVESDRIEDAKMLAKTVDHPVFHEYLKK